MGADVAYALLGGELWRLTAEAVFSGTATRDGSAWDTSSWAYAPKTGLCSSKTYADGSSIAYSHTSDCLPLRTTSARGAWRESAYGADRRLSGISYSGNTPSVAYARDTFGRVTDAALSTGRSTACAYDADDDVVSETTVTGDGPATTLMRFRDSASPLCGAPSGTALPALTD